MTFFQTATALVLASLLAACGGQADIDSPMQLASVTTVSSSAQVAGSAAAQAAAAPGVSVASATMPAPDCAAEGCASLRIIDGNAEAWRIDAQRRAAELAQL